MSAVSTAKEQSAMAGPLLFIGLIQLGESFSTGRSGGPAWLRPARCRRPSARMEPLDLTAQRTVLGPSARNRGWGDDASQPARPLLTIPYSILRSGPSRQAQSRGAMSAACRSSLGSSFRTVRALTGRAALAEAASRASFVPYHGNLPATGLRCTRDCSCCFLAEWNSGWRVVQMWELGEPGRDR